MAHVCHFLTSLAGRKPRKVVSLCQGRAKTAQDVLSRISSIARALIDVHGLCRGDRVALVARNTDFFFEALMAVVAAGAIAVPINLRWSLAEATSSIELVGAQILFIDEEMIGPFGDLARDSGRKCIILGHAPTAAALNSIPKGCCRIEDLVKRHTASALNIQAAADGAALICFTSGTSGSPKGAVLSHAALHAQALAKLLMVGYSNDDVYLHCAPLFHIGGLSSMLAVLAAGGMQVFQPVFSAHSALDLMVAHSVTAFIMVPAMAVSITEAAQSAAAHAPSSKHARGDCSSAGHLTSPSIAPGFSASAHHSPLEDSGSRSGTGALMGVKRVLLGGGELAEHLQWRLQMLFPCATFMTAYGMTEACSSITFRPMQQASEPHLLQPWPQHSATRQSAAESQSGTAAPAVGICVGQPPPGIEVAVLCSSGFMDKCEGQRGHPRDADVVGWAAAAEQCPQGVTAAPGEVGEVLTRGPQVMLEYWGDPGASASALLPGGWLRTGDLGMFDGGGALWLMGRLKDVVRSGSENVNAAAVERVLLKLPGVAAAAVVGLPHDRLGEQVCALLVIHADVQFNGQNVRSRTDAGDTPTSRSSGIFAATKEKILLNPDNVVDFCRQHGLSGFMVPRLIVAQYEALPTNASGKVLKHTVRERLLQGTSGQQNVISRL